LRHVNIICRSFPHRLFFRGRRLRSAGRLGLLTALLSVGATAAGFAQVPDQRVARGLLQPRIEAMLSSQIAARILRLPVREGQRVTKGELLVEFDCESYRAELAITAAELESARIRLSSNQQLAQLKSIGRFEVALAEAEVVKAEAALRKHEIPVSRCKVPAPFGGRVGEVKVHAHESVEAGDEMLALLDDRSLEIRLIVPSAWLAWLRVGQGVRFTIDETGVVLSGQLSRLGARIDPVSQTVALFADVPDSLGADLVAGMTGSAMFTPEPPVADPQGVRKP